MAPTSRPEHHINLNYIPQLPQPQSGSSTGNTSPVEPLNSGSGSLRFANSSNPLAVAGARLGAGSPSHDYGGRLFSKRFVAR
jgi:protein JSN1